MISDPFKNAAESPMAPAEQCFAVTPADGVDLAHATKALFIGTGGDVCLRSIRGEADVLFRNLPSGYVLDVRVRAVRATGTTATDLVGLA